MEWYHLFVFIVIVILAILYVKLQSCNHILYTAGGEKTASADLIVEEYNIFPDPLAAHGEGIFIIGHVMAPREDLSIIEKYIDEFVPGSHVVDIGEIVAKKGVIPAVEHLRKSLKIFHHQPLVIFGKNYEIKGGKLLWINIPGIKMFRSVPRMDILKHMQKKIAKLAIDRIEDMDSLENFYSGRYYNIYTDLNNITNSIYWYNVNCQINMSVIKPSLRVPSSAYAIFLFYILQQAAARAAAQATNDVIKLCKGLGEPEQVLAWDAIDTGKKMQAAPLWDSLNIFPANKYKDKLVSKMVIPEKILRGIIDLIDGAWDARPEIFWITGASGSGKSTLMKRLQFDDVELIDVDKYDDEMALGANKIENCPVGHECPWNSIENEKINREYQLVFNSKKPKIVFTGSSTDLIGAVDHLLFLNTPAELNYVRKNIRELNTICDNRDKWINILNTTNPDTINVEMERATIISEYRGLSLYRPGLINGINNYKNTCVSRGFKLLSADDIVKYINK